MDNLIVGIDATRSRSGGAVSHIRGIISASDPRSFGIETVHLWAYPELLDKIPNPPWLIKHCVNATKGPLFWQLTWQFFVLPIVAKRFKISVLFNTDAGSVCQYSPSVTLSQDMLSFEASEIKRVPLLSTARLRLEILKCIQIHSLSNSSVALFLTQYAKDVIGKFSVFPIYSIVPHGVDSLFSAGSSLRSPWPSEGPIRCLYVSNVSFYKHQWHVVSAIRKIRDRLGLDLRLHLVGGVTDAASKKRLLSAIRIHDPLNKFVQVREFVPNEQIATELQNADLFVFASSCENLPITLLEAMASGLPIASSYRGPMPEVLGDAAAFFDPEDSDSIDLAISSILSDAGFRESLQRRALIRSKLFTWKFTADLTWKALVQAASV